jgi:hypothetical protein
MNKNETKRDRFVRIVERRVDKILNNLDSLGKCSNRKNYEYSEKDVKKIFGEIDSKIKEIRFFFKDNNKTTFKLE